MSLINFFFLMTYQKLHTINCSRKIVFWGLVSLGGTGRDDISMQFASRDFRPCVGFIHGWLSSCLWRALEFCPPPTSRKNPVSAPEWTNPNSLKMIKNHVLQKQDLAIWPHLYFFQLLCSEMIEFLLYFLPNWSREPEV